MRAALLENGIIRVLDAPELIPGRNEVLVKTLTCGICGSDLHQVHKSKGRPGCLILGHEYCAEVLDYGAGTTRPLPIGSKVVSLPFVAGPAGPEIIGFSATYPGGFGERMILGIDDLLPVPDDVPAELAALTEPLAVGEHAVTLGRHEGGEVALVVGCGPVGLAVIAALRLRGCGPILAADFSAERRVLAEKLGAHVTFDPARESPYSAWREFDAAWDAGAALIAYATREKRRRVVIYECVGAPGVISSIIEGAPIGSTIVVAGSCNGEDSFSPFTALVKEINLQFANAYSHDEFAATLGRIADGTLDVGAMITRTISLDEVDQAISQLSTPTEAKIMIRHDQLSR